MEFNPNDVGMIDQDTVEAEGSQYPTISFHNGSLTQKKAGGISYEGGWFIDEESTPADMTTFGWVKDSFVTRNGEEVVGYWASQITVSVIQERKRWISNKQPYAWNDYDNAKKAGNPRGHQQYLVLLKGAENLGLFMIGLKGHAAMSFKGNGPYKQTGGLSWLNRTVIAAANAKTKPQKWAYRAFWLTVGVQKDAKGQPAFIEVGTNDKSQILLPVPFGLPEKAADVDLGQFYVGKELLATINGYLDEATMWKAVWDSFDGTAATNGNGKDEEDEPEVTEADAEAMGL